MRLTNGNEREMGTLPESRVFAARIGSTVQKELGWGEGQGWGQGYHSHRSRQSPALWGLRDVIIFRAGMGGQWQAVNE